MEVIMSSSAQECLGMENDRGTGAAGLTKSQKKNRRRLLKRRLLRAGSESFDKREDVENPSSKLVRPRFDIISMSSLQDKPNTGVGTAANVDQIKTVLSAATTSDGKSLISRSEEYKEIAKGDEGLSRTTADGVKSGSKREAYIETANDMRGSSENTTLDAIGSPDARSTVPKRERHLKNTNDEAVSGETSIIDANTELKRKEYMETASDEAFPGRHATPDEKTVSKGEEQTMVADGELGSIMTTHLNVGDIVENGKKRSRRKKRTRGENLNLTTADLNVAVQEDVVENEKKRSRRKKRSCGEILNVTTADLNVAVQEDIVENEKKRSGQKKTTCGELNLPHLKDTNAAIDETCTGTTATDNTASKKRKRQRSKNKRPASGDMTSTCESIQNMVIAKEGSSTTNVLESTSCEIISGKTATDNTVSKKRKRRRSKNKRPASGDITSTCESIQNMVIAKEDSSTTNVLESTSCEIVSGKTATPDAKMVSKGEEFTKPVDGKMDSSATTILHVNGTVKKKKKRKSKIKKPTIDETMNPKCLQDKETANGETGSDTIVTDGAASKKVSEQKGLGCENNKPASGDILSAGERTHDRVILKNDLDTNNLFEGIESLIQETPIVENTEVMTINEMPHVATSRKKLLVLDVNGLLADVLFNQPKGYKPHISIQRRAIFKRPFMVEFLHFCFKRFDVAIWSSRTWKVLNPVVNYLLGGLRHKLVFVWDASYCTKTQTKALENKNKCIVFKDLRKIWQNNAPGCSWVKGTYHEANTLLVDDSPYKAFLNPKHTGVFPVSYSHRHKKDKSLGPNGDIRTYLQGLAGAADVKTYVAQHPFGQAAIDETNPHWAFYSQVVRETTTTTTTTTNSVLVLNGVGGGRVGATASQMTSQVVRAQGYNRRTGFR